MAHATVEVQVVSFAEVNKRSAQLRAAGNFVRPVKRADGMWELHVRSGAQPSRPTTPKPVATKEWHHGRDRENLRGANASGFLPCSTKELAEQIQAGLLRKGALRATIVKGGVSFCF